MIVFQLPDFTARIGPFFRLELGPVLQVACEGLCAIALLSPTRHPFGPVPECAFVALLADRPDGALSDGPSGFHSPSLTVLLQASSYVAIASRECDLDAYSEAAAVVRRGHSAVIIETGPEREEAWLAYVKLTLAVRARSGSELPRQGGVQ